MGDFLIGQVGNYLSPAMGIVGARLSYVTEDWSMECANDASCIAMSSGTARSQRFFLSMGVRYTLLGDLPLETVVLPPPTLPKMADDVFYPFTLSLSSAPRAHVPVHLIWTV